MASERVVGRLGGELGMVLIVLEADNQMQARRSEREMAQIEYQRMLVPF